MKNNIFNIALIMIAFLSTSLPVLAQGAPPSTPIDGGLSVLLLAGGAYGLKKIREQKKSN
jgi:hypothetical protein